MYTCLHVTNFYLASDKFKCNLYLNVTNFYLASDKIRIESDVESILNQAFSESTASTFDRSLMKEKAPYTIRNALGLPLMVQHSANLRVVGSPTLGKLQEVAAGQSVDLDHSMFQSSSRGKLSALQRQESCLFNLTIGTPRPLPFVHGPLLGPMSLR